MSRIAACFAALKKEGRAAFIPFIMAGDPDLNASTRILHGLPAAGADLIELGVCFTDPMADGPAIQAAGIRAREAGQTLAKTLDMVRAFRASGQETPIILMGYFNPFYAYGVARFLDDAKDAGVDGLIVVDLPPEEDDEFCLPAKKAGLDFIRLATPTTDQARLPAVVRNASGFIYYVSVAGVTGAKTGAESDISSAVNTLRAASSLPVAVGFGVKTKEKAAAIGAIADAVVVGSALVERVENALAAEADAANIAVEDVLSLAQEISQAVRDARL